MILKMWQVDAFARRPFEGNPAAIVPLDEWLDTALMQKIANENNLAETAFFVKTGAGKYDLRWFTPEAEVDLCGHATLASAWTIFEFLDASLKSIAFETRSGTLVVDRGADGNHLMSLPSDPVAPYDVQDGLAKQIGEALGIAPPDEIHKGRYILAVWNDPKQARAIKGAGDIARVLRPLDMWGLIATAPGDEGYDIVLALLRAGQRRAGRSGDRLCALRAGAVLGEASGQKDLESTAGEPARRRPSLHRWRWPHDPVWTVRTLHDGGNRGLGKRLLLSFVYERTSAG
ncbi:MAG: PhzF family phenazine biosynthesis isomerase [Rhizomicrobium sp.]